MKRFVKLIVSFVLFSFVVYSILILIWGKFSPFKKNLNYKIGIVHHSYTRLKDVKNKQNVDLLFLGSSHSYFGFDSRLFKEAGYSSFNLGTNNQTPIQGEILLNRYIDKLNPKLVIIDVCPVIFSRDGIESSLVLISNDNFGFDFIKLVVQLNHIKLYNTLIYKLWRDLLYDENNTFSEDNMAHGENYIEGGFVENKLKFYEPEFHDKKKWEYSNRIFRPFIRTIETLKNKKIDYILVQTPITKDFYNSYSNNDEFDEEMKKYGKYYNFNKMLKLNDTIHFQDPNHLNKYGIEIFNDKLIKILDDLNF